MFSCSVSVSVRLELARLDRQELRPDRVLRPHSRTGGSGDSAASTSRSASELAPRAYPQWGRPMSARYRLPCGGVTSPSPSSRREKLVPRREGKGAGLG